MKPPIVSGNRIAEYTLRRAVLVYEAPHGDHYATLHPVTHEAGRAAIGAGQPLTESALRGTLQKLGAPKGIGGWVASDVLYMDEQCIVWTRRPAGRAVFFTEDAGVGATRGHIQHPRLVFAVTPSAWYVAAVPNVIRSERSVAFVGTDRDGRPRPNCPLAHAPYFNVYQNAAICTGNATLPKRLALDTLQGFEDAFFDSKFTHSNNPRMTTHPGGPVGLWKELLAPHWECSHGRAGRKCTEQPWFAKEGHRCQPVNVTPDFPDQYLTPMNLTLEQFVGQITKGRQ